MPQAWRAGGTKGQARSAADTRTSLWSPIVRCLAGAASLTAAALPRPGPESLSRVTEGPVAGASLGPPLNTRTAEELRLYPLTQPAGDPSYSLPAWAFRRRDADRGRGIMQVRLLGSVDAVVDGEPRPVPGSTADGGPGHPGITLWRGRHYRPAGRCCLGQGRAHDRGEHAAESCVVSAPRPGQQSRIRARPPGISWSCPVMAPTCGWPSGSSGKGRSQSIRSAVRCTCRLRWPVARAAVGGPRRPALAGGAGGASGSVVRAGKAGLVRSLAGGRRAWRAGT